jgi:hypothetical protein
MVAVMSEISIDQLKEWGLLAIPSVVEAGLEPRFADMFAKNLASGNKRAVKAAASDIAEMVLDLLDDQRVVVRTRLIEATGLSPEDVLAKKGLSVADVLKRGHVKNKAEFRVLDEAMNDGRLSETDAQLAAELQADFVVRAGRPGEKRSQGEF